MNPEKSNPGDEELEKFIKSLPPSEEIDEYMQESRDNARSFEDKIKNDPFAPRIEETYLFLHQIYTELEDWENRQRIEREAAEKGIDLQKVKEDFDQRTEASIEKVSDYIRGKPTSRPLRPFDEEEMAEGDFDLEDLSDPDLKPIDVETIDRCREITQKYAQQLTESDPKDLIEDIIEELDLDETAPSFYRWALAFARAGTGGEQDQARQISYYLFRNGTMLDFLINLNEDWIDDDELFQQKYNEWLNSQSH